jgi:WD40 repeat protein
MFKNELKINKQEKNANLESFEVFHEIDVAYSKSGLENNFDSFLYYEIPYLVFATKKKSLISYNLNDFSINTEIMMPHEDYITNIRHYIKDNNIIYILSISRNINEIKMWNFQDWECIFNLRKTDIIGNTFASIYINKGNKDYILTSNSNDSEYIQLYDLKGNRILSLNNSQGNVLFLDYFYDNQNFKYYIIAGCHNSCKSFDLEENKLYHKYYDEEEINTDWHASLKINLSDNKVKLIDSCWKDDFIRIWDFHKGILLSKFKIGGINIKCICHWDKNLYFIGNKDYSIKLVDIKNEKVIKTFNAHKDWVVTIRKIKIDNFGECLISQGLAKNEVIKIWKMKI